MTIDATIPVKLTANERRALAEFGKPSGKVNWDKVHGHTRHALQRKKLIEGNPGNRPGWRCTAAGHAALVIPNIFDDLFEPKEAPMPKALPDSNDAFRVIERIETTLHDTVRDRWVENSTQGGVRLYCTASPYTYKENARWALQIRAQVKTKNGHPGKHFAIGNASMSREDLQWLRDQINKELRRKVP